MALPLYDFSVKSFLQGLTGVAGFLEKGRAHFTEAGVDLQEVVETRLIDDMRPLRYQIVSAVHHSRGAIEALKSGLFSPPVDDESLGYADLQTRVAEARKALEAVDSTEINALVGGDLTFQIRDTKLPYVAEDFILSFSLPNFYFHATTAYDILRQKGVPIGKRDYLGGMRTKA
jgi:uncharacterized protein